MINKLKEMYIISGEDEYPLAITYAILNIILLAVTVTISIVKWDEYLNNSNTWPLFIIIYSTYYSLIAFITIINVIVADSNCEYSKANNFNLFANIITGMIIPHIILVMTFYLIKILFYTIPNYFYDRLGNKPKKDNYDKHYNDVFYKFTNYKRIKKPYNKSDKNFKHTHGNTIFF